MPRGMETSSGSRTIATNHGSGYAPTMGPALSALDDDGFLGLQILRQCYLLFTPSPAISCRRLSAFGLHDRPCMRT